MVEAAKPCPICGKPLLPRFRPFCSARCADVDLGRWFTEGYATPASRPPEEEEDNLRDSGDDGAG